MTDGTFILIRKLAECIQCRSDENPTLSQGTNSRPMAFAGQPCYCPRHAPNMLPNVSSVTFYKLLSNAILAFNKMYFS
jgi:hypothetical protein